LEAKLQRKYYVLTASLGFFAAAIGATTSAVLMYKTRALLGLPMETSSLDGIVLQFVLWIGVTLVSIPVCFYGAMVLVGGTFGLIMLIKGSFTPAEVKGYMLSGRYPKYWYRTEA
jgi:hypothetical protein